MANEFLTKKVIKATFNATDGKAIGAYGLGVFIPSGAVITDAYYRVRTTFTSATDAGTIALSVLAANDLKSAIAISDATNVWDAGVHGCLPGNYALDGNALTAIAMGAARSGSYILLTSDKELTATIAVEALTAGVLDLYVEYYN